jgi:hypothetical protein
MMVREADAPEPIDVPAILGAVRVWGKDNV